MGVQLTFYGAAAYRIVTVGGQHVVMDPFLNKNVYSPVKAADLVGASRRPGRRTPAANHI